MRANRSDIDRCNKLYINSQCPSLVGRGEYVCSVVRWTEVGVVFWGGRTCVRRTMQQHECFCRTLTARPARPRIQSGTHERIPRRIQFDIRGNWCAFIVIRLSATARAAPSPPPPQFACACRIHASKRFRSRNRFDWMDRIECTTQNPRMTPTETLCGTRRWNPLDVVHVFGASYYANVVKVHT